MSPGARVSVTYHRGPFEPFIVLTGIIERAVEPGETLWPDEVRRYVLPKHHAHFTDKPRRSRTLLLRDVRTGQARFIAPLSNRTTIEYHE